MSTADQSHIMRKDVYSDEKDMDPKHIENGPLPDLSAKPHQEATDTTSDASLTYILEDEEPVFHARTYIAIAALWLLNFVQVFALTGPPVVLSYIGTDLNNTPVQNWVPNALSLVQAVGGPLLSFASDTFQARKTILIGTCAVSFIGAAIAPGASNIYRVIVAQILVGFGFAAVPLAYSIPSEILPKKWRPFVQSFVNLAASAGAVLGPLTAGALTKRSAHSGWRHYYWVQMGLWGATILGIVIGYRPPRRHTQLDGLTLSQKIGRLDLPGMSLLTCGLTLLLTGLSLGDTPWAWSNVRVLTTLIIGIASLICFGLYEWKGTKSGILHHELFHNRTFPVCVGLIFIEGIELFTIIVFYPALTGALFEERPLLAAVRTFPFWLCSGAVTMLFGYWSSSRRTFRGPMFTGFALFTAGLVGIATIQPGQSTRLLVFDGLAGLGFASPLVLIIAAVQLATPHHLIATATAVVTSTRAVAASSFTAIYGAALTKQTAVKIPKHVAAAAIAAGLPAQYVTPFVGAFLEKNEAALKKIPDVTPAIIGAAMGGLDHALADSFRIIYIIAIPFGVLACCLCYFLTDMSSIMNYRVDAPVEELRAKRKAETIGA